MWKRKEEEELTPAARPASPLANNDSAPRVSSAPAMSNLAPVGNEVAHIGKSVIVKGELSGSEDLSIDGTVEGSVQLDGHNLVIGPNGRVRAQLRAKQVVVQGKVDGNITASERVELRRTAVLVGDIFTPRIAIEEGAFFKGGIEVAQARSAAPAKPATAVEPKKEAALSAAQGAAAASSSSSSSTAGGTTTSQGPLFPTGSKKL